MARGGGRRSTVLAALTPTNGAILGAIVPPPGSVSQIVWLLHDAARLWRKCCDREIRARLPGMTWARCVVLMQLARHKGVNQAALARMLDIAPITLARLLDRLQADGFVARMPNSKDRRAHVLAPTAKALPMIEHIYQLSRTFTDEAQLGISRPEVDGLLALLWRVRSNLVTRPRQPSADATRGHNHA